MGPLVRCRQAPDSNLVDGQGWPAAEALAAACHGGRAKPAGDLARYLASDLARPLYPKRSWVKASQNVDAARALFLAICQGAWQGGGGRRGHAPEADGRSGCPGPSLCSRSGRLSCHFLARTGGAEHSPFRAPAPRTKGASVSPTNWRSLAQVMWSWKRYAGAGVVTAVEEDWPRTSARATRGDVRMDYYSSL
jgi:hypothetical protein